MMGQNSVYDPDYIYWVRNDRFQTNEYVTFNFDADYLRVLREHFVDNSHLIHPLIHGNFIWEICCG